MSRAAARWGQIRDKIKIPSKLFERSLGMINVIVIPANQVLLHHNYPRLSQSKDFGEYNF